MIRWLALLLLLWPVSAGAQPYGFGGPPGVPSGSIVMVNGACPGGYTEVVASQGRFIVGTPAGGTQGGTLGTAITDQGDSAVPTASAPAFTGTAITTTSASLAGALAGAFGTIGGVAPGSSFTPAGTVATPTITGGVRSTVSSFIQLRMCSAP